MLVVRGVAAADVDDVAGRLWLSGGVAVVVEAAVGDGAVDLRIGLREGARVADVRDAVPARWRVEELDDDAENRAVADALRAASTVVRAGDRLVVAPPWASAQVGPDDVLVVIDPGAAFGSGSHVTTRMALAAVEHHVGDGSRVLDVGCGTGVLSVAAARLGARVVAVDVEPHAIEATAANAGRNGVAGRVEVVAGGIEHVAAGRAFDLVVANLGAGLLVALAPALLGRLTDGARGVAVLTGILDERTDDVRRGWAAAGGEILDRESSAGWTRLTGRRSVRR